MKKTVFSKKLSLNKATIAHLDRDEMSVRFGGGNFTKRDVSCQTEACCNSMVYACGIEEVALDAAISLGC